MPPAPISRPRPRRPPHARQPAKKPSRQDESNKSQPENAPRPPHRSPKIVCTNRDCSDPKPVQIDGERVCENCGSIISQDNIVAEVTFGENSAGAAVVQGGFIGEGQRHAKTLGGAINRKVGGGLTSREQTHQHFQQEIAHIASSLNLQQSVRDGAFNYMKLALVNNFTYGRPTSTVAAVAIYLACRTDKENNTLLMDLAEAVKTNVYKLGRTYQELAKLLYMDSGVNRDDVTPFVEVERLILKYAKRLEFGLHTYKVAEDAAKIIKRMKRDWMLTGRRPAGLCGAALILAARMNNFRRTVREVVYVVKVADMTIAKRLDEFDRTTAGALTVDQFRQYGANLKTAHDPPVFFDNKVKEERARNRQARKRTRSLLNDTEREEQGRGSGTTPARDPSQVSSRPTTSTPTPSQELRRDAEGFAIPAIPIDPRLTRDSSQASDAPGTTPAPETSRRGRKRTHSESHTGTQDAELVDSSEKRKRRKWKSNERPAPVQITATDLASEAELENEINRHLHSSDFLTSMESVQVAKYEEHASRLARSLTNAPTSAEPAPTSSEASTIPTSETILESEFAHDPEVANCLLSDAEIAIKERIWVTHNEDWLRAQQARLLKRALQDAAGKTAETAARAKTRKKRSFRRGDGSSKLDEDGALPANPAEASARMLKRFGQRGFSKHINYERLNQIYQVSGRKRGKSENGSNSGSGTAGSPDGGSRAGSEVAESEEEERSEAGTRDSSRIGTPRAGSPREEVVERGQPGGGGGAGQAREEVVEREVMIISDDEDIDDNLDDLDQYLDDDDDVESVAQSAGMGIGDEMDDFSQYADDD